LLDTINFGIVSDAQRTTYQAQIRNNKDNPQYTFNSLIDGIVQDRGTIFGTRLYDDKGELGVRLGLAATMQDDGFMFRSYGKDPILGYKTFHVNDDNYVFLGRDRRVSADVSLRADDGTGVQIYTNDENTDALQDITASLHHFDLERVLSVIPYTPDVSGMMSGDFHVIQTDKEVSVSTNLDVKDMAYERWPMGDIGTEFVYMPKSDGSHYVDGILSRNGEEVATVSGTYQSEGKGYLDAQLGHRLLEDVAVLAALDGVDGGADDLHAVLVEHAVRRQGRGQVQAGLPAEVRQQRIRALLLDDLGQSFDIQGLDVDAIRGFGVGHDRSGVAVHQNDFVSQRTQRLARLRAGIVEFACLADDDGA
jgi:hypothetical protein